MKIKEFKLISEEENGTFPQLKCVAEHEVIYDDIYLNFYQVFDISNLLHFESA